MKNDNLKLKTLTFLVVIFTFSLLIFTLAPRLVWAQEMGQGLNEFTQEAQLANVSLPVVIGRIVRIVLGFLGLIGVIIVIIGGFKWMTSGGLPEKIAQAKKIMIAGLIGLAIIVFAFAIVSLILRLIGDVTGPPGGQGCQIGSINGCYRCVGPDPGHWVYDPTIPGCTLPPDAFKVSRILTTHGGSPQNYHQNVYLCSAVQSIFNHWVDTAEIARLAEQNLLKIQKQGGAQFPGQWQAGGNFTIFKHPENLFEKNTNYQAILSKAIKDTAGKMLQACQASGGCSFDGTNFIWNFAVGETNDTIAPTIVSTYPIFDSNNPAYPDRNVSRKPLLEVNFSEPIDATTVGDQQGNLIPENIWVARIRDGQQEMIPVSDWAVEIQEKGFRISLKEDKLLEAFAHYLIHVGNVRDLCNNLMDPNPVEWEFWTNDRTPGVESYNPTGDKVCPNTNIAVIFNTQMFESRVKFEILKANQVILQAEMKPAELQPPYKIHGLGGWFLVEDTNNVPPDPVNNHFRVFKFDPDNDLDNNTEYIVRITTDLVINQAGDKLNHQWTFKTATPETCLCAPWISYLSPNQGPNGQCLTIHGECFTGTQYQIATPTKVEFILNNTPTLAEIGGYDENYIATVVPTVYQVNDRPSAKATIIYQQSGSELSSNLSEFYVNQSAVVTGPCLWSFNPSSGQAGQTQVTLSGKRFGDSGQKIKIVRFYNNQEATFSAWADDKITGALVPAGAQDGEVVVINNSGISNGLPFDVIEEQSGPGQTCRLESVPACSAGAQSCQQPSTYFCLANVSDCRCCCRVNPDSCSAPLQCKANMGLCSGTERGLCCGCQNDNQCGSGLGCGILDPNRCCYGYPTIEEKNPSSGQTGVCLNTAIRVKFNQKMDRGSLNLSNIKLEFCGDDQNCSEPSSVEVNLTVNDYNSGNPKTGFTLYPANCRLTPLKWYRVKVTGGLNGSGVRSEKGVSMAGEQSWVFQTGSELCAIDRIDVNPLNASINVNDQQNYSATAYADNQPVCVESFAWASSQNGVATVEPALGLTTKATGRGVGQTTISATAQEVTGNGLLIVKLTNLQIEQDGTCNPGQQRFPSPNPQPDYQEACVNIKISARFNKLIQDATINKDTILVQKCLDDGCELVSTVAGVFIVNLYSGEPAREQFIFTPNDDLSVQTKYRIIVKSGEQGVKGEDNSILPTDFVWQFKTRQSLEQCPVEAVAVTPILATIEKGDNKSYLASATGKDCQLLTGSYTWAWQSTNVKVATVNPAGPGETTTATGLKIGETDIQAETSGKNNKGHLIVANNPLVEENQPIGENVCRNALVWAKFDQEMDRTTLNQSTVLLFEGMSGFRPRGILRLFEKIKNLFVKIVQAQIEEAGEFIIAGEIIEGEIIVPGGWQPVSGKVSSYNVDEGSSTIKTMVNFIPDQAMNSDKIYKVVIRGGQQGVKSKYNLEMAADKEWQFTTGNEICKIEKVGVEPLVYTFAQNNEEKDFSAAAYAKNNQIIFPVPGAYSWNWSWETSDLSIVTVVGNNNNPSIGRATADNKNGFADIRATATDSDNKTFSGRSRIIVFLCEQPWSYENAAHNLKLSYCRDAKPLLPLLSGPSVGPTAGGNLILNLLFNVSGKPDVIGLQIYNNFDHLTPQAWYLANVPNPGSVSNIFVDGYYAAQSGRTAYVGAANLTDNKLYSNIYLLSYNDNASPETINIVNQLIKNWQFNTNEMIDKTKIQRDLTRIYHFNDLASLLESYKTQHNYYPKLEAGTYIKGLTTSRWPSWQTTLGQDLGKALPIDPLNKFANKTCRVGIGEDFLCCADCPKANPQCENTCYNSAPNYRRYECINGSNVYQYQTSDGNTYSLYSKFEYSSPALWQHDCGSYVNSESACKSHHWCEWNIGIPRCKAKNLNYSSDPCFSPSTCACFNMRYQPLQSAVQPPPQE